MVGVEASASIELTTKLEECYLAPQFDCTGHQSEPMRTTFQVLVKLPEWIFMPGS